MLEDLVDENNEQNKQILFLIEQLNLINLPENSRRYSPSLLVLSFLIYATSPAIQSDSIERRFSWYRQKSGGNYLVSTNEILSNKKISKSDFFNEI